MWIAADEITARRDLAAMETISYCGVRLLATAHAKDLNASCGLRPLYRELLTLGMFQAYVCPAAGQAVSLCGGEKRMIRMIGAALVVLSSGAVGFGFARAVKLQCAQLEGLLWALDTMQSEMSARLTPLAQLFLGAFRLPAEGCRGFFCGSRKGAVCAALLHGAGLRSNGAFSRRRAFARETRVCRRSTGFP